MKAPKVVQQQRRQITYEDTLSLDIGKTLETRETFERVQQHQEHLRKETQKREEETISKKMHLSSVSHQKSSLPWYVPLLFILIAMMFAGGVRWYVASLPMADDWAEQSVRTTEASLIAQQIQSEYALYSSEDQQRLIKEKLEERMREPATTTLIKKRSDEFRDNYKDPQGNWYLYGLDSYYYYLQAKRGEGYTSLWSRALHLLGKHMPLERAAFYFPTLIFLITIIPIYFIARKLSNDYGAFVTSVIWALHPTLLQFTALGIADTNHFNIFFMVVISWLFIEMMTWKGIKLTLIRTFLLGYIIGVLVLLFKMTWGGYFSIIVWIAITLVVLGIVALLKYAHQKSRYLFSGALISFSGIGIVGGYLFYTFYPVLLQKAPETLRWYLHLEPVKGPLPDMFQSIKELQMLPLGEYLFLAGGIFAVLLLGIGIVYLGVRFFTLRVQQSAALYLFVVFITLFAVIFRSVRFFPYLLIPSIFFMGLGFSVVYTTLYTYALRIISTSSHVFRSIVGTLIVIILLMPIAKPMSEHAAVVTSMLPAMNDAYYHTALAIKDDSTDIEHAAIVLPWDRGHIYRAIAERPVIGEAQPDVYPSYIVDRVYTSQDEEVGVGWLRLLSCGNYREIMRSVAEYEKHLADPIPFLEKLYVSNGTAAAFNAVSPISLRDYVMWLLNNFLCDPHELYVVVSDEWMSPNENIGAQFNYFRAIADWDFRVAEVADVITTADVTSATTYIQQYYNISDDDAQNIYARFLKQRNRQYSNLYRTLCQGSSASFVCGAGLKGSINPMNVTYHGKYPQQFIYVDENVTTQNFSNAQFDGVVIVYNRGGYRYGLVVEPEVANSLYIRLLLLRGYGLSHFKRIAEYVKPELKHVAVYKVIW